MAKMSAAERDFEKLYKAMSLMRFRIESQFYAKPTHIVDPHNFFLIPFSYIYHLPTLNKAGEKVQKENIKENSIVIYTSEKPDLNKYYKIELDANIRGMIQKINEDQTFQIYALDYGFIENNVQAERIYRPMHEESFNIPPLAQHCELSLCAPIEPNFSERAIDAFKFYIGNEKLSVVIKGKVANKLKVVIYNSNPDDIATLLALTHYTYLTANVCQKMNAMTVTVPRNFDHVDLEVGETFTVRVQSGTSLKSFYVTPMNSYSEYLKIRADFTNYCRSAAEITAKEFRAGAIVGVQEDINALYERGVILDVESETATVKLLDWGTEVEVPKCQVKYVKTKLFTMTPAFALYCKAVKGFKPWDNGLPKFLYKGYSFSITVVNVGKGFETPNTVSLSKVS